MSGQVSPICNHNTNYLSNHKNQELQKIAHTFQSSHIKYLVISLRQTGPSQSTLSLANINVQQHTVVMNLKSTE